MDVSAILAVGTLFLVMVTWLTDYFQWRAIRSVSKRLEIEAKVFEERGDVGDQIGDWLLHAEKEGEPNNLQVMGNILGQSIAGSFRMASAGIASGDSRRNAAIERRVLGAMEDQLSPELKLVKKLADKLGLGDIPINELLPVLEKNGLLKGMIGNNGQEGTTTW